MPVRCESRDCCRRATRYDDPISTALFLSFIQPAG
jgi:hypothetical protein